MNPKPNQIWVGLFLLGFLILSCSKEERLSSKEMAKLFADPNVVAIVNGETIKSSDVDLVIKQFLHQLGKNPDQFLGQKPDTALWNEALNWLVSMRLLIQEAQKQNIKIDDAEVDRAVTMIKRRFPSEQKFLLALSEANITMEQFMKDLTDELRVQKLLDQKLGSKIEDVTEEDALEYYHEHGDKFIQNDQIRVHHLLIKAPETMDEKKIRSAEDKARRILERIKKGEDFEELARQYSDDPSALKGGDLGFFSRGDMIKNFEDAAFALKEGEISEVVRTPLGFHIIRMDEKKVRQRIPFNEIKSEIIAIIKKERSEMLFQTYVEELKANSKIRFRGQA